jgi:cysteine-rich repeat protein
LSFVTSLRPGWVVAAVSCVVLACFSCVPQPTVITCDEGFDPCDDGCVDLGLDDFNCGRCGRPCDVDQTCVAGQCMSIGVCANNNGGCSPDAFCMDIGGTAACLCAPGLTGDGIVCDPCSVCGPNDFMAAACTPTTDTVCNACTVCGVGDFASTACSATADAVCSQCSTTMCAEGTQFISQACGGTSDKVCSPCTTCGAGMYAATPCNGFTDRTCGACTANCAQCAGPGATCFVCDVGFTLSEGNCLAPVCGNAQIESGEMCDDGDNDSGDGCSSTCQVEAGSYCFGETFSTCRAGTCLIDTLTGAVTSAFVLDGAGTPSAGGTTFSQRSTIRTAADIAYPLLIEVDVVYAGNDVTFAGARGPGTRDGTAGDEPTDTLRGRLTQSTGLVELVSGTNTVEQATNGGFVPQTGVPYRVRYVDDGQTASIQWFNLTFPPENAMLAVASSFHGSGDRAFVGGGDQGNVTMSNLRVCSAPVLPVSSGLVAHYSAIPSWTVTSDMFMGVTQWQDVSGNGRHLAAAGLGPIYQPGAINLSRPGMSFAGGAQLNTAAFPLTTQATVFAVIHHKTPDTFGAIAHHGSRDNDWSMEQSGNTNDPNELHWQTNNDNVNVNLTLVSDTSYVMTGRIGSNLRYFSATAFSGTSPTPVSFTDVTQSISAGNKILYLGTSDNNEASNANIADFVYYDRELTDPERDAVIAYLLALWRP